MTQEQLDLLRSVAEQDKDNCVSIAMLALLDLIKFQAQRITVFEDIMSRREHCHCGEGR